MKPAVARATHNRTRRTSMSNIDQTAMRADAEARSAGDDQSLGYRRLALLDQQLRRRGVLGGALGLAGLAALGAPSLASAQDDATPVMGDDAAPPEQQVMVVTVDPNHYLTQDLY